MKNVKTLTRDAFVSTIIVVINLAFNLRVFSISELVSIISMSLLAAYFADKRYNRAFISSLAIIIIGFLFTDIYTFFRNILPTVVLGNALIFLFRIMINKIYLLITAIIMFVAEVVLLILDFYFLFNLDFLEFTNFLIEELGLLSKWITNTTFIWLFFIVIMLIIGLMKAILSKQLFVIYWNRIRPVIK